MNTETRIYDELMPVDLLLKRLLREQISPAEVVVAQIQRDNLRSGGTYWVRRYGRLTHFGDQQSLICYRMRRDGKVQETRYDSRYAVEGPAHI